MNKSDTSSTPTTQAASAGSTSRLAPALAIPAEIGEVTLTTAEQVGGIFLLFLELLRRAVGLRIDRYELVRNAYRMGVKSVSIVVVTSLFNGAIMVVQAAPLVERFGANEIIGWAAGWGVLNELGPLLVSLMFSGRVGANNTAELGTMVVTEQVDALRALAIDPLTYLILPRVIAMVVMLVSLNIVGMLLALIGAVVSSYFMLDVGPDLFVRSFLELLTQWDYLNGVIKSLVFGVMIAITSSYYGLQTKGGAPGVGVAVKRAVVGAAIGIFSLDYIVSLALR